MRTHLTLTTVTTLFLLLMPLPSWCEGVREGNPLFEVRDFGAVGDGVVNDTGAIQSAVNAANQAGGGTVWFPAGTYLSGTLLMKDQVTLHLVAGATLLGSTDLNDYPMIVPSFRSYTDRYTRQSLLYGEDLENIAIEGRGTIDGNGEADVFRKDTGADYDLPYGLRPYVLRFVCCRNVRVSGITLRDSAMWMQHYLACDDVTIDGIHVDNHVKPNNDMIDIDCCRNVRISNCTGDTDDDALTLKSTADRITENVTIANCVLSSHCNAIKMGTESSGGFRNIAISNCAIRPSRHEDPISGRRPGLAGVALEIVDGGFLDRVTITNLTIEGTIAPIFMRLGNRARKFKEEIQTPDVGAFRNVVVSNVMATGASGMGCAIAGLPGHPIENVVLSNIRIAGAGGGALEDVEREIPEEEKKYPECTMFGTLPAYGFYARHVKGLTLDNVEVAWEEPDLRPALLCDDVRDLHIDNLAGHSAESGSPTIVLNDVQGAMVQSCVAPAKASGFLRMQGNTADVTVIGNDLSQVPTPFEFGEAVAETILFQTANRLAD